MEPAVQATPTANVEELPKDIFSDDPEDSDYSDKDEESLSDSDDVQEDFFNMSTAMNSLVVIPDLKQDSLKAPVIPAIVEQVPEVPAPAIPASVVTPVVAPIQEEKKNPIITVIEGVFAGYETIITSFLPPVNEVSIEDCGEKYGHLITGTRKPRKHIERYIFERSIAELIVKRYGLKGMEVSEALLNSNKIYTLAKGKFKNERIIAYVMVDIISSSCNLEEAIKLYFINSKCNFLSTKIFAEVITDYERREGDSVSASVIYTLALSRRNELFQVLMQASRGAAEQGQVPLLSLLNKWGCNIEELRMAATKVYDPVITSKNGMKRRSGHLRYFFTFDAADAICKLCCSNCTCRVNSILRPIMEVRGGILAQ